MLIEGTQNNGTIDCSASATCLRMHNGGILAFWATDAFCGTTTTNALPFGWDPDGEYGIWRDDQWSRQIHNAVYICGRKAPFFPIRLMAQQVDVSPCRILPQLRTRLGLIGIPKPKIVAL